MKVAALIVFLSIAVDFSTAGCDNSHLGCCKAKSVGGVHYNLMAREDTSRFGCESNCSYERPGQMGKFCFKQGSLEVVCGDEDEDGCEDEDEDEDALGCGQSCGCIQIRPVGAFQSSEYINNVAFNQTGPQQTYGAEFAIDRNGSTYSDTATNSDPFPWLAVELPGEQPVSRVVLMYRNAIYPYTGQVVNIPEDGMRWKNLQVRVANSKPTTADSSFMEGTRIAFFPGPSTGFGFMLEFSLPKAVTGMWVVVQIDNATPLDVAEVLVYSG